MFFHRNSKANILCWPPLCILVTQQNNLNVTPKKASFIRFSLKTENRMGIQCLIALKLTYFSTWNWNNLCLTKWLTPKPKTDKINQDVKTQWPGVSTDFVHLFLCPIISISLSTVENKDQLVSSFILLLIFKSCPTGGKKQNKNTGNCTCKKKKKKESVIKKVCKKQTNWFWLIWFQTLWTIIQKQSY